MNTGRRTFSTETGKNLGDHPEGLGALLRAFGFSHCSTQEGVACTGWRGSLRTGGSGLEDMNTTGGHSMAGASKERRLVTI